jgi:polysaccharide export outer membrane protein
MPEVERMVQKNDRLQITFGAKDDEAAAIFNKYGGVLTSGTDLISTAGTQATELSGYLVDAEGNLEFPVFGKVHAEGLTGRQLKDTLTRYVFPYLKNPLVNVRFITFKITVLGEVKSPGIYNLPLQKSTILDALGISGDLSHAAQRYDVQIYRDYNGERTVRRIDLRKQSLLNDPDAFFLKNNDVIYVQPRSGRVMTENAGFWTSLLSIGIGFVTLIIALTHK